tara:strand:+ start:329 stop:604 length:276 start_codon:yes stop_codon:yes gene_type:complete
MVPRFKSLIDFMLAKKWFQAQWAAPPCKRFQRADPPLSETYFANAERHDIERRLRRHFKDSYSAAELSNLPDFSETQNQVFGVRRRPRRSH